MNQPPNLSSWTILSDSEISYIQKEIGFPGTKAQKMWRKFVTVNDRVVPIYLRNTGVLKIYGKVGTCIGEDKDVPSGHLNYYAEKLARELLLLNEARTQVAVQ